jgi:hypothetical protein
LEGDGHRLLWDVGVLDDDAESVNPFDANGALIGRLRAAGVDVRPEIELVGFVNVDRHVEAELSDERIENYDVVVIADDGAAKPVWRIIAGGDVQCSDAVATVTGALAALGTTS